MEAGKFQKYDYSLENQFCTKGSGSRNIKRKSML